MKRFYTRQYHDIAGGGSEWHWKPLCVVWDNEALGFMERLLTAAEIEFKVEDVL